MKLNLKPVIASVGALAITGGVLAATVGTAAAATTPPWEPDANSLGSLTFYNSAGAVVTGGTSLTHLFDYAQASTADANTGTKATLYFAQPTFGQTTGVWPVGQASTSVNTPPTGAPAPLNTSANPVATVGTGGNLQTFINQNTAQTQSGYVNVYQVRVVTTGGAGGSNNNGQYWESDIAVNPTAGTWVEEYPTAGVVPTTTTVPAIPTATGGTPVTLTANVAPTGTPGSVDFTDTTTSTDFGNGTYTAATGVATLSHTFAVANNGDTIKATFTPTDLTSFAASSGTNTVAVNPPATPTATALVVTQDGVVGDDVNLSASVTGPGSTPNTAGTVSFFDNGSATPLNAAPVTSTTGTYVYDVPAGLAAGSHSIVAKFTPTSVATYQVSQSSPQAFILNAAQQGACASETSAPNCTDTQNIEATIPTGTLTISTPYSPANPLNLGSLALNTTATEYTANAPFTPITITDNRSGGAGWTASALSSNLTGSGTNTINAQNVGLTFAATGAYTESAGDQGVIALTNNPAAEPAVGPTASGSAGLGTSPHVLATSTPPSGGNNDGTVAITGTLTLNAPTSTVAGLYTGTITFTVG